ncbi:ABC transporter permease subunit [Paenibacillus sp. LMG 31459]|uniref:ABC transporter permease subunit n=1 Tax=Paenibacillus phytohabitans TaxID=2654978 RepID=A0ABX1YDD1_9BACL|nr:ABC transporter permease subunit [Paenibacillus phytohabitans]NOU79007.1 ABC transporter permease subunit [Paenibacillus phytohabitans]
MNTMNKGFWWELKKHKIKLLMLLPAVIYFFVFNYLPMAGIIIAFKRYDYVGGIFGSPWVGFENFRYFIESGQLWHITKNTVLYNLVFLLVNNLLEIVMAILLAEMAGKYIRKFLQSAIFLPYFISWVVVSAFVYNVFNYEYGSLNSLLASFGMDSVDVYSKPTAWVFILIFFSAWKTVGYGTVFYLAAIMGIDSETYEAAEMDGANIFQRVRHITLPALIPTAVILLMLSLGGIVKGDFQMFYQIVGDNGLVYNTTDVIDTFVVRSMLTIQEFGMPAAAGLYQSVVSLILIVTVNYLVRKAEKDLALF